MSPAGDRTVERSESDSGLELLIATLFRARNLVIIAAWVVVGGIVAFASSFLFEPWYEATAVVVPANAGNGPASGLARLASDLGDFTGVGDLSVLGGGDRNLAQEILQSKAILGELIDRYELLPIIFAETWDSAAGQWRANRWGASPSRNNAVEFLDQKVRHIDVDRQTGAIRITMKWRDRQDAATWANSLVELVNLRARDQAIREAEASVALLTREAAATDKVELQSTIFGLIGSQVRAMTVARSRDNFLLRVIDPATPPEEDNYEFPNRALMTVATSAFAAFIVLFWLLASSKRGSAKR